MLNNMLFNDYEIGRTLTTPARVIDAAAIDQFAALTGDHNPLHLDETYAAATPFGRRIAHGLLVQSCAVGLVTAVIDMQQVRAFREVAVKFSQPVFVDDAIHVVVTVAEKKLFRRLNAGNITLDFRVINSDDQVVQRGRWQMLIEEALRTLKS